MKAVFIVYNQSLTGHIEDVLSSLRLRGFTRWTDISGTGSEKGMPHEGTHTWPELNNAHLVVTVDEKVTPFLEKLRNLNNTVEEQGLRAFVWHVQNMV